MAKERDSGLDIVAGIMIVYMIYGHICCWTALPQIPWISDVFFIFMPFFFIKAGLYSRKQEDKELIVKSFKRLVIPYLTFSIIGHLVFCIRYYLTDITDWHYYIVSPIKNLIHEGACAGNAPLWFLITLFCVRVLFNQCLKVRFWWILPAICICMAYVGAWIGFNDYFILSNICSGLFFYAIGHFLIKYIDTPALLVLATIVYIGLILLFPSYIDMRSNQVIRGNYIVWVVASIMGFISWRGIMQLLPWQKTLFGWIGIYSMTFYVWHWVVFGCVQVFLVLIGLDGVKGHVRFYIFAIASIVILPLINYIKLKNE